MKLPVYLYPNVYEVVLDLDDNNRIIQVMYQRNLKVQKGIKNTIQIQFKNSDQKFLNISTGTFVFSIYDTYSQRNLLEKSINILDAGSTATVYPTKGLGEVVLSASDLEKLERSYYRIGIKALDSDGAFSPVYADTYYDVAGTMEVKHDLYPTLVPSQEVTNFQFYYNADIGFQRYEYYSGNLPANPQFKSNEALHTVAVYMSNYKGQVIIEGTLENSPMTFGNYAVVNTKTYNGFTGIDYTNFNGIFSKVRVRYIPDKNPVTQENDDPVYAGTVDRVLYRS
jgi:hypothetical protein